MVLLNGQNSDRRNKPGLGTTLSLLPLFSLFQLTIPLWFYEQDLFSTFDLYVSLD